jgi:TFIIF-interacting CTD phosphatase-like protein
MGDYHNPKNRVSRYGKPSNKDRFTKGCTSSGLNGSIKANEQNQNNFKLDPESLGILGIKHAQTTISEPFLPEKEASDSRYTLVLDLDETLIHYVENGEDSYFLVRPYCKEFLHELSKYYELVIFTAGVKEYADWVIDQIDPEGKIKHRLYREHTWLSP